MTTRISPDALQKLLRDLPPEAEELFPQLSELGPEALLARRIELSTEVKRLEEERKFIDSELQDIYSDAELRNGVKGPGGWIIQQRNRTSWSYDPDTKDAITKLQKQAQRNGLAEQLSSTYLCLSYERPKL